MGATWREGGGGGWHSWDTHKWEPLEIEKGTGDIFY